MNSFSIDYKWLAREHGNAIERAALADIAIYAAGHPATELEDLSAKTVRSGMRVSAYVLARWFAANWWRLLWEPERKCSFSWKMSHKVGAAGNGYLWPNLTFISDGAAIHVRARPSSSSSAEAVRYLSHFDAAVPAADFEQGIDVFIEGVIGRLDSMGAPAQDLAALWQETRDERYDPHLANWRKLEALLGFDPGDAPDRTVKGLLEAARTCGPGAIDEMAAESSENALADIRALWDETRQSSPLASVPDCGTLRERIEKLPASLLPWQRATEAACTARKAWAIGPGPVTTRALSEVFGITHGVVDGAAGGIDGPMNAGFRNGDPDAFGVYLKSPFPQSRRFALLRLVGDHLSAPPEERLLPATTCFTYRQKFQRAFAQEVLCPYSELSGYIGHADPTDDLIEDAAQYFDVSPLMVKTILVNKGDVSVERFAADISR